MPISYFRGLTLCIVNVSGNSAAFLTGSGSIVRTKGLIYYVYTCMQMTLEKLKSETGDKTEAFKALVRHYQSSSYC